MSEERLEPIEILALADLFDDADYVKCVRIVPDMDSTSEAEDIISGKECAVIIRALRLFAVTTQERAGEK